MQLESHATPQRESPQQRYANLHRAIERGLDSDEIWKELADVSLSIGHGDEAVRCMRSIRNDAARFALESKLARLGLTGAPVPGRAPTAPGAAPGAAPGPRANEAHTLRDHVTDAFQYLFHQHMPWLVLLTTLAFPLVVGVGGFLTAGSSVLLLTAIAALPGLCVVSLVGAMGRQILLTSAEGNGDVPPVPSFADLVDAARAFLVDAWLVLGVLIGPSLLALWLGAPLPSALPTLAIGVFFVPMAWALRHLRGDLQSLSPVTLVRAIARGGFSYVGIAGFTSALFAPAAGVAWIAFGRPLWVQIAIIGPLCVLPLFLASRLIGTWLDVKRTAILGQRKAKPAPEGAPASGPKPTAPAPAGKPKTKRQVAPAAPAASARAPQGDAPAPRQPRRPESLEHFRAPVTRTSQRAAAPVPTARVAAAPAKARAIEGRGPAARADETSPELDLPGRVVVSGTDRVRRGAAAKRP